MYLAVFPAADASNALLEPTISAALRVLRAQRGHCETPPMLAAITVHEPDERYFLRTPQSIVRELPELLRFTARFYQQRDAFFDRGDYTKYWEAPLATVLAMYDCYAKNPRGEFYDRLKKQPAARDVLTKACGYRLLAPTYVDYAIVLARERLTLGLQTHGPYRARIPRS